MLHHITSSPSQSTRKLLKKGYSKSLVAVLEKLLEKDPDKRYQSASELSEDIKRVQNNQISKALLRKPFLISVSKTAGITALATALALSLTTLCAFNTYAVLQLKNSSGQQSVYDSMVSRHKEKTELMNKIINLKGDERLLSIHSLYQLMSSSAIGVDAFVGVVAEKNFLSVEDQQRLVQIHKNDSSAEVKKALLETLSLVPEPQVQVLELVSSLCSSKSESIRNVAVNSLCRWISNDHPEIQPAISSALSRVILEQPDLENYSQNSMQHSVSSINDAFSRMTNYSEEAIKNIRKSAELMQPDTIEGNVWHNSQHPLISISKHSGKYYPELAFLLAKHSFRNEACKQIAELGPAAKGAAPALLATLKRSGVYPHQRTEIYQAIGAIGPSVARECVPVLDSMYQRHREADMRAIAAALVKMGPDGIAVLKREAQRSRKLDNEDASEESKDSRHNLAIETAQDALSGAQAAAK
jgi:serine/threonine protein kinase